MNQRDDNLSNRLRRVSDADEKERYVVVVAHRNEFWENVMVRSIGRNDADVVGCDSSKL